MGQQATYERDETIQVKSSRLYKKLVKIVETHDEIQGETCGVTDILANLRHICDAEGWDFAALDRQAYQHYRAEWASKYAADEAACKAARAGHAGIAEADL